MIIIKVNIYAQLRVLVNLLVVMKIRYKVINCAMKEKKENFISNISKTEGKK